MTRPAPFPLFAERISFFSSFERRESKEKLEKLSTLKNFVNYVCRLIPFKTCRIAEKNVLKNVCLLLFLFFFFFFLRSINTCTSIRAEFGDDFFLKVTDRSSVSRIDGSTVDKSVTAGSHPSGVSCTHSFPRTNKRSRLYPRKCLVTS